MTSVPSVPNFVLGAAAIGRAAVTDAASSAVIGQAIARGVGLVDTAPHYGCGLSERRIGAALAEVNATGGVRPFLLSTKVGRTITEMPDGRLTSVIDTSYDGAWRSLEGSLERLQVDAIDIVHVHDPDDITSALDGVFRAVAEMREQGIVRAVSAGMNEAEPLVRVIREVDVDFVMIATRFNLLDREAESELLPLALERSVGVWSAGAYATGVLADPTPTSPYRYRTVPPDVLERAVAIRAVCERYGVTLRSAALQFAARHPAVVTTVVGIASAAELDTALEESAAAIPQELWDELAHRALVAPIAMSASTKGAE